MREAFLGRLSSWIKCCFIDRIKEGIWLWNEGERVGQLEGDWNIFFCLTTGTDPTSLKSNDQVVNGQYK